MTLCEYASFDVYFVCIHTRLKTFCILQIIPRCTSRKYYISMFGFSNRPKRIFRGNQEIYFSLCSLCYIRRPRKRKKSDFFLSERAILHDALVECYLLILSYIFFSIALLFRCNTRLCCPSQGKDFVTLLLFPLRHTFLVIFLVNFWLQPSRPGIQPSFVQIPTSAAQSTFDSSRGVTSPRGGLVHCLFASSSDGANSE